MPRRASLPTFSALSLDPDSGAPLHRQLYDELRRAILSGRLAPGARLPATRELAKLTDLSRNTVLSAYEQLRAEGYVEGQMGSGTFVARALPEALTTVPRPAPSDALTPTGMGLSRYGRRIAGSPVPTRPPTPNADAFRIGLPALDAFPMDTWRRLFDRRWRRASRSQLTYDDAQGYLPLREAIAEHLAAARGVRCGADQVIVVNGAQQAVDLAARVLLDPGDTVLFEDPGYTMARHALDAHGVDLHPVPVDQDGMIVSEGIAVAPHARLAYVTPSHQNPTGVTMSLSRRMLLLQWARRERAWVLEDDNASEYRYAGRPIAALQGIDTDGRTLYIGTFSKVLFSSLRLGYLVAPPALVPVLVQARQFSDRQSSGMSQAVLADFMIEGHFARHLRRMRVLYAERLDHFVGAIARFAADSLTVDKVEGGINRVGWLAPGVDDREASRAAESAGVRAIPLSMSRIRPVGRGGLVMGFAGVDAETTDAAMRALGGALRPLRPTA
jgi:GntR family transcriptional regulator/MocR family aminotransferase